MERPSHEAIGADLAALNRNSPSGSMCCLLPRRGALGTGQHESGSVDAFEIPWLIPPSGPSNEFSKSGRDGSESSRPCGLGPHIVDLFGSHLHHSSQERDDGRFIVPRGEGGFDCLDRPDRGPHTQTRLIEDERSHVVGESCSAHDAVGPKGMTPHCHGLTSSGGRRADDALLELGLDRIPWIVATRPPAHVDPWRSWSPFVKFVDHHSHPGREPVVGLDPHKEEGMPITSHEVDHRRSKFSRRPIDPGGPTAQGLRHGLDDGLREDRGRRIGSRHPLDISLVTSRHIPRHIDRHIDRYIDRHLTDLTTYG